ncbi:hypothetical protein SOVF_145380 isoform B [Spinacia oleracea]|nr:hypothetical protein SOVF_145380 isoform B [Spinacia oleracea]
MGAGSESSKTSDAHAGSEASKTSEDQKRKARAEGFGLPVSADEEVKKKARLARFGSDTKTDAKTYTKAETKTDNKTDTLEEDEKKARALRSGSDEEVKKKARLSRFGSDTKTDTKAETKTDNKTDTLEEDEKKARALRFVQPPSKVADHINAWKGRCWFGKEYCSSRKHYRRGLTNWCSYFSSFLVSARRKSSGLTKNVNQSYENHK